MGNHQACAPDALGGHDTMITFRHDGPEDTAQCTVCGAWVRAEDLPHHGDILAEVLAHMDQPRLAKEIRA